MVPPPNDGAVELVAARDESRARKWPAFSLLLFSTGALALPIVLFRRYRTRRLLTMRRTSSAPPRRSGAIVLPATLPISPAPSSSPHVVPNADDFNAPLYAVKALSVATLIVLSGGAATVWAVKTALGIENVPDFANRIRAFIRASMPTLVSRVNDHQSQDITGWNKADAERRMQDAYKAGGLSMWARAALTELEAEYYAELQRTGLATALEIDGDAGTGSL